MAGGPTLFASDEGASSNEGFVSFVARFNDNNRYWRHY